MKKTKISDEEILQYMDFDSVLSKHKQIQEVKDRNRMYRWLLTGGGIVIVLSISWIVIFNSSSNQSRQAENHIESGAPISQVDSLVAEKTNEHPVRVQDEVKVDAGPLSETVKKADVMKTDRLKSQEELKEDSHSESPKVPESFVFVPAEPVDGYPALYAYFEKEVKYPPAAAKADSVKGVVTVAFTINDAGEAENIVVEESLGILFDAEAKRAVQHMPKWKPASYNGKPIASRLSVPITFQITRVKSAADN